MKPKRIQTQVQTTREMWEKSYDPVVVQDLLKRQMIDRLAQELYNNVQDYIKVEENGFVGITHSIDLVVMTTREYDRLMLEMNRLKNADYLKF
jgi:hypothetical protein